MAKSQGFRIDDRHRPAQGFLLTSFSIAAVSPLREIGGWPLAFGLLAVGPALGIAAMRRLERLRARPR